MKVCSYCRTENNDQAAYCVQCGLPLASLPQEEKPEQKVVVKKKKRLLPILLGAAGVVTLAVIVLIVSLFQSVVQPDSKFLFPEMNLLLASNKDGKNCVLIADTKVVGEPVADALYSAGSSLDGNVRVFQTKEDALYVATKDGFSRLCDDARCIATAVSGKAVAFVDTEHNLYLQRIPMENEPLQITNRISTYSERVAISPDGNTLVFVEEEMEQCLYVYSQGNMTLIGMNLLPLAVSNEGEYIYCTSFDQTALYLVDMERNLTEIAKDVEYQYIFNQDHTQVLFYAAESWFALDHGEKIQIPSFDGSNAYANDIYMVTPEYFSYVNSTSGMIDTYGVENLTENYYKNGTSMKLSYLDENWNLQEISSELSFAWAYGLSKDGNTIFYAEHDRLYQMKQADMGNRVRFAVGVTDFEITSKGEAVYYLDDAKTLWYQTENGEATKIQEGVDKIYMTHDDYLLFGVAEERENAYTLYAVKDSKKPSLVAEHVASVTTLTAVTTYFQYNNEDADYTYNLYGTEKGIDFQFIAKEG